MADDQINTHGLIVTFGRHKDKPWTRVPISYLKWIRSESSFDPEIIAIAKAEMERRGTPTPEVDISGHAIDRASLHCRKIWHEDRASDEGLYAWLCRITMEALDSGARLESGKIKWKGMKFVIIEDGEWPVLKTIMRS